MFRREDCFHCTIKRCYNFTFFRDKANTITHHFTSEYLKAHAPSIVTPMIITNLENKELVIEDVQDADPGKLIMTVK